jgi:hypothetical protein
VCQKSRNQRFKGKYFCLCHREIQFPLPRGNIGHLSLQVRGLKQYFFRTRRSSANCLCNKHHTVFNHAACVFVVQHYFRKQPYEAVKQAHRLHFLTLLYQISEQLFDLLIKCAALHRLCTNMLKRVELYLQQGGGHYQHML